MKASFRTKIVVLFSGLIVAAQVATIAAVVVATQRAALRKTEGDLQVGAAVFREDLEDQRAELLNWVEVLSRDYGFIEAVATGERSTISSALANHGGRVHADLALVVALDGSITASREESFDPGQSLSLAGLLEEAGREGRAIGIAVYGGAPYQVVLLPVYAPLKIAWVCMGFLIDDRVAEVLKSKTFLDVSFWVQPGGAAPRFLASTLPPDARGGVSDALANFSRGGTVPAHKPFLLPQTDYLSLAVPLFDSGEYAIFAVLQTSMHEALESYRELRRQLIEIFLLALCTTVGFAIAFARSVTRPVQTLLAAARRISEGNYVRAVELASDDEFGVLAAAFNEMQKGIAAREEQVVYQASHDPLTGLYNRAVVNERLTAAIARARRADSHLAVLLLDLDRFKEINDKLGHRIGDRVLQRVAQFLLSHVRESDTVLRLGGDEFLIMLEGCDERSARLAATTFVNVLGHTIDLEDMQIALDISLGLSVYPEHGEEADMLMRRAQIALYGAKQQRVPVAVYQLGQDEKHLRQLAIIGDFTTALQSGQISLHFQPKVDAASRDVVQAEVLLRWVHPQHGPLRADEFIPLAERSGHIRQITRWVMDAGIEQAHLWRSRGLHLAVAINLSAIDLCDESLPDYVQKCLALRELPASSLVLEVTETAVMQNAAQAARVLERFRSAGIKIALDDFGTGHSSLAQLKRIPVDELKIDKSFVLQLKEGSEDAVIVRATADLGHAMSLIVVAEGVEDEATAALLQSYGCDLLQGYFISRPLPAREFEEWIVSYYAELATPAPEVGSDA